MSGMPTTYQDYQALKIAELEEARLTMVRDLDRALHGDVSARTMSPQAYWSQLLEEVRGLARYARSKG